MTGRFTKAAMLSHLEKRAEHLKTRWSFVPGNGSSQVLRGVNNPERIIAYGEFTAVLALIHEINGGYIHD
jgi:hypothetical protein